MATLTILTILTILIILFWNTVATRNISILHVMKEVRDEKLLTKKYIKDHHLLFHTCNPAFTQQRFDFYCDCCPEWLKDHQHDNLPLIHAITKSKKDSIATFFMLQPNTIWTRHVSSFNTITMASRRARNYLRSLEKKQPCDWLVNASLSTNLEIPILHHNECC